jgi:hypothetical protein
MRSSKVLFARKVLLARKLLFARFVARFALFAMGSISYPATTPGIASDATRVSPFRQSRVPGEDDRHARKESGFSAHPTSSVHPDWIVSHRMAPFPDIAPRRGSAYALTVLANFIDPEAFWLASALSGDWRP